MSFFEPPARPTAEVARAKVVSPPAWIAPPHNVLPGIAPVQLIVARTDETVAADAGSAGSEKLAEAAFRDERLEHGAEVAVGETAESAEKPDWPVGGRCCRPVRSSAANTQAPVSEVRNVEASAAGATVVTGSDAEGCGSGHAGELVVVQEDDYTTAYQAAGVDALSFTRIQAGAATRQP
jgi:hypothetical protein